MYIYIYNNFRKRVLLASQRFRAERETGENLHHIDPSSSSLKFGTSFRQGLPPHPTYRRGGGRRRNPAPTDPLSLASRCPLTGMSGSRVEDGVWGRIFAREFWENSGGIFWGKNFWERFIGGDVLEKN